MKDEVLKSTTEPSFFREGDVFMDVAGRYYIMYVHDNCCTVRFMAAISGGAADGTVLDIYWLRLAERLVHCGMTWSRPSRPVSSGTPAA